VRYLIEPLAGSQQALVFGLTWASTIGANPQKQARQHARRAKAQFYTRGRTRSTVVGTLTLRHPKDTVGRPLSENTLDATRQQSLRRRPSWLVGRKTLDLYSAAAAFAHAYDRGAVAVHLPLRDGWIWVSAAVDGIVQIGSDVIHASAEAAQQHLQQLRALHPGLQVLESNAASGQTQLREGVFLDHLGEAVKLQRVAATLSDLPMRTWLTLGALAAILIWQGIAQYRGARQQALRDASVPITAIDPVSAWKDALHTWSQGQAMHGMSAIDAMMASIARFPVAPGRWELDTVDCQPAHCQALYRRTRLADNPSLQAALPPEWRIQWHDMDSASVSAPTHWQGSQRGDITAMPDERTYVQDLLTHWQRLRPAMEDIRIGAKTLVNIPAPVAPNADGNPAPLPFPVQSGLIRPALREITVHAPLRTIATLAWPAQSQVLLLQVHRSRRADVHLTRSAFHATLKGVMYVQ